MKIEIRESEKHSKTREKVVLGNTFAAFKREIYVQGSLQHPNIVNILGITREEFNR
jgi:hypothetical protein